MSPEAIKRSVAGVKRVREELSTLRELSQNELDREDLGDARRGRCERLLAGAELTSLLRLFAAFEGGLEALGTELDPPYTFPEKAGLAEKLDKIGSAIRMPSDFREEMDREVRELRNELGHGRSFRPRLSFEAVHELILRFYRGCR